MEGIEYALREGIDSWAPLWRLAAMLGCSLTIKWTEHLLNGLLVIFKREINIGMSFHES